MTQLIPDVGPARLVPVGRDSCLRLLATESFGRVVVTFGTEHRPLIRPVNYVFDPAADAVCFCTGEGTKLHALLRGGWAAFEIDGIDRTRRTGWSVVLYGVAEPITAPGDIRRLAQSGLDRFAPPGPRTQWMRIRTGTVTGMRIERGTASGDPLGASIPGES